MSPTNVILTIDTEFSIAGAFTDPARFNPVGPQSVLGASSDGTELGLGFILDTLARHGATATFFVEVMNTAYFGLEPMGAIARRIADAGHDVQLHIHPCWMAFQDGPFVRKPGSRPPNDSCGTFTQDELVGLLEHAIEVFDCWGLQRPVALRTGGFSTSLEVYEAQRRVGIPIASNVCTAIAPPSDPNLHLLSGRRHIGGVVEVPALSFVDYRYGRRNHLRPFQITAVSSHEIRHILSRSFESQVDSVVAVTHPFEFYKRRGDDYSSVHRNRINQTRLSALCEHVESQPSRFSWTTFGAMAPQWKDSPPVADRTISGSPLLAICRMAENGLNDRFDAL